MAQSLVVTNTPERSRFWYLKRLVVYVFRLMKHPLTLLFLATVLSNYLIPRITYGSRLKEERLSMALKACESDRIISQHLNRMYTLLAIFYKDTIGIKSRDVFNSAQSDTRAEMVKQYLDFDKDAWWWFSSLEQEAAILRNLTQEEQGEIQKLTAKYKDNIVQNVEAIDEMWIAFLRRERTDFRKNTNSSQAEAPGLKLIEDTKSKLNKLKDERSKLVGQLIYIIAPKQRSPVFEFQ
jgi:hypothetical protein